MGQIYEGDDFTQISQIPRKSSSRISEKEGIDLKQVLINEGIVKIKSPEEEPFTLKSGKKSRLFIDIKQASLNPRILSELKRLVVQLSIKISQTNDFDIIGSVAIGAIPIATVVSLDYSDRLYLYTPQVIVRSEKHDRGTQSQVIGDCKGKRVLLIEDVATSGDSIINAVNAIRLAGGECNTCIVIVDREEGAKENCNHNGIRLHSLLKKSDFGISENL